MSIHSGHRNRLKERFRQEGLEKFHELQVLELLLFYSIPQKDTNPLAHALLERFGSVHAVLEAKPELLAKVAGVGQNTALYLNLLGQLMDYCEAERNQPKIALKTPADYYERLRSHYHSLAVEKVCMLCLNARNQYISCAELTSGDEDSVNLSIRMALEHALGANARFVVLAHNHPSGEHLPTDDDVAATVALARTLSTVGVILLDHLVITERKVLSMRDSGYYFYEHHS